MMGKIQKPEMVDRRGEALGGQSWERPLKAIKYFVWHYTATHDSFITNHERYWRDHHGWDRGGYHFYIDRNGVIYQNYDLERITWGVANSNNFTAHVSCEAANGNDYTAAQIKSRELLTRWIMQELPWVQMKGHYEVYNNTSCPGYTKAQLDNFRRILAQPVAQVTGAKVYKVVHGDTLWKIATANKMTVERLKQLNGLTDNLIVPGQELKLDGQSVSSKPNHTLLPLDQIAKEVIDGKFGNGQDRIDRLKAKGYNPFEVQAAVDQILQPKESIEVVAEDVIAGKYGTGDARKRNLEAKGYNYNDIQAAVNRILKYNEPKSEYIYLPADNATWGVYRLNDAPVRANIFARLAPAQFGGLEYKVLRWAQQDVAVIQTEQLGQVKIYVGADTNAQRKWK